MSDSKQPDSDRAMARLLADALRYPAPNASDSACPDAEVLAAYAEHNLNEPESAQWEKHFAACGRCQKILAVLTVSGEEPLTEAELERFGRKLAAAEVGTAAAATRQPSAKVTVFARPQTAWRWLAPALGVAAAAALWIALRPIPRSASLAPTAQNTAAEPAATPSAAPGAPANPPAAPGESLEARANVPLPPAEVERQAEQQQLKAPDLAGTLKKEAQSAQRDAAPAEPAQKQKTPQVSEAAPGLQGEPVLQAANKAQQESAQAKPSESTNASVASAPVPAGATPPAAPAPPQDASADAAGQTISRAPAAANSVTSAQTAPSGQAEAQAKTAPNRTVQLFEARQALAGVTANAPGRIVTLTSPSANVSWRVGPRGEIQRSTDRGQSWQPQASGVTSDLLAGAAPSDTVAWVVGRAGVILRTTDGNHWQRITSPDSSADWATVQATDSLHATITSTDQRHFATEDGGQTWRPL